jgi:hypothetical protein
VVVEQLVHWALLRLHDGLIKRQEEVKDLNVKQDLIMDGEGSLSEALNRS